MSGADSQSNAPRPSCPKCDSQQMELENFHVAAFGAESVALAKLTIEGCAGVRFMVTLHCLACDERGSFAHFVRFVAGIPDTLPDDPTEPLDDG